MGKGRPINRNPFRRRPWRTKKRPTRWNGSLTLNNTEGNGEALPLTVLPTVGSLGPLAVLIDGSVDVEPWSDEQEVTLDRLVGSFNFTGQSVIPTNSGTLVNNLPYVKCGLLVVDDLEEEPVTVYPNISLWNQEDYEDHEWMWRKAFFPENVYYNTLKVGTPTGGSTINGLTVWNTNIDIDIGVRRKIGPKAALCLYAGWVPPYESGWDIGVALNYEVRAILMSR